MLIYSLILRKYTYLQLEHDLHCGCLSQKVYINQNG